MLMSFKILILNNGVFHTVVNHILLLIALVFILFELYLLIPVDVVFGRELGIPLLVRNYLSLEPPLELLIIHQPRYNLSILIVGPR